MKKCVDVINVKLDVSYYQQEIRVEIILSEHKKKSGINNLAIN